MRPFTELQLVEIVLPLVTWFDGQRLIDQLKEISFFSSLGTESPVEFYSFAILDSCTQE